jgi:hypothetical protein
MSYPHLTLQKNRCDGHHREKIATVLFIASGQPPIMFETIDEALNHIAFAVGFLIKDPVMPLVPYARDDHFAAMCLQIVVISDDSRDQVRKVLYFTQDGWEISR